MFNEGQNEQTPRVRCDHMYRRSQVVQWVHLCPQGGEKLFRHNLLGNVHPQAEQEPIFSTFFCGRVRFGGGSGSFSSFRPSFEGRRLRKVINFGGGETAPQTKSWLRLWSHDRWHCHKQAHKMLRCESQLIPATSPASRPRHHRHIDITAHIQVNIETNRWNARSWQATVALPHNGNLNLLSNSSFSVAAPSAWNRLPSHIRTSSTYILFLTRLKTHLFAESLLWHCYAVVFSLYFWCPRALDVGRHSKFMLIDWCAS